MILRWKGSLGHQAAAEWTQMKSGSVCCLKQRRDTQRCWQWCVCLRIWCTGSRSRMKALRMCCMHISPWWWWQKDGAGKCLPIRGLRWSKRCRKSWERWNCDIRRLWGFVRRQTRQSGRTETWTSTYGRMCWKNSMINGQSQLRWWRWPGTLRSRRNRDTAHLR